MNKLEKLENKIKELSDEIEKMKAEKKNEVWKPKDGVQYWYVNHSNGVLSTYWLDNAVDKMRYDLGNVFSTREEAESYKEQLKVEAELRRFARPFDEDERNWAIIFDVDEKEITTDNECSYQSCNIHFASEEIAQKAIDTVGEARIKKYYFGVED